MHVCPQDEAGLLDLEMWLGTPATDTLVYCCGPEPLIGAVQERCRQVTMGSFSVAAPVRGPDDVVVAAVSLVVSHERADPVTLVPLVRAAGRGISRALVSPP